MPEKFVERAKEAIFYESEGGGNEDVRMMLSRGDSNSRVNQEMSNIELSYFGVVSCWRNNWKLIFEGCLDGLERMYINLNGYSRVQAIEMRGRGTVAQRDLIEPKQRGGILGLFSKES